MGNDEPKVMYTAEELYQHYLAFDGDIKDHLPYLRYLASQCDHVTELGTRAGISTVALLAGHPKQLITYDINEHPFIREMDRLATAEQRTLFYFVKADVLSVDIQETDLLFIDTWHVYEQLRAELRRHSGQVRHAIVLHDTETFGRKGEVVGHKGLMVAVEEFLERGTFKIRKHFPNCNGLTVLERIAPESKVRCERCGMSQIPAWPEGSTSGGWVCEPCCKFPPAKIFLGIPWYQSIVGQMIDCLDPESAIDPHGGDCFAKFNCGGAFHARNFNQLWAAALNTRNVGWTHFAMIHADVRPHGYWLSTMLYEMRKHGADLLSVVLPMKNDFGLTSTAVYNRATGELRRLTMTEIMAIEHETFNAEMAGFSGWEILPSTGLWICDFTKPWVEDVWFEVRDRIVRNADGVYGTETVSEDWAFMRTLNTLSCLGISPKVMATKAVPAGHWGMKEYRNDEIWGTWKTDQQSSTKFGGWEDWPQPGKK